VAYNFASWWVATLPVGGFGLLAVGGLQLCQLVVCGFASWWVAALPVGGLGTLGFSTKIFLVTLPQIFCMGKSSWGM
jgi:hypothetical protein